MFKEITLQRVQNALLPHALDCLDPPALRLRGENKAGAHELTVQDDTASPAISGAATFLNPGKAKRIAERVQQSRARIGQKLDRIAIYRSCDMVFAHARSSARR